MRRVTRGGKWWQSSMVLITLVSILVLKSPLEAHLGALQHEATRSAPRRE